MPALGWGRTSCGVSLAFSDVLDRETYNRDGLYSSSDDVIAYSVRGIVGIKTMSSMSGARAIA